MQQPGLLPLDKPVGLRSAYCVERVRKLLGRDVKVGHGGTLDSTASGILVLLIAGATRLSNIVMQMPKTYSAVLQLGTETSTCDYSGDVTETADWTGVNESQVDALMPAFLGWRLQTPPKVSAVHVGGRRAHEIFRGGEDPDIKPRPVHIRSIRRTSEISEDGALSLQITCGKGTYVRSVACDLGRMLGCGAHIRSLRRERVGCFDIGRALAPDANFSISADRLAEAILPLETLTDFLPSCTIPFDMAPLLANGVSLPMSCARRVTLGRFCPEDLLLVCTETLYAVVRLEASDAGVSMRPEINILAQKEAHGAE